VIAQRLPMFDARRRLPLTLLPGPDPGIRGSLPLPASGERAEVRGTVGTTAGVGAP
jgi:hypothetical protein